jgi:putative transcriptional regulator
MPKYKSDAFQAIHEDAVANFEVGAITREELEEYDRACLVSEIHSTPFSKTVAASSWAGVTSPAFASKV